MTNAGKILSEMQTVRDDVRVRLHLLSLEAQQQWRELESALENVEYKAGQSGEELTQSLLEPAHKLAQALRDFLNDHLGLSTPARSLMTPNVLSCVPEESVEQAARIFWERNCGAVPVVDGQGKLIGMLTDRDVCIAAYTQGRRLPDISVASVMSTKPYAVSQDDSVERVLEIMKEARVRRVPVVDDQQRVVGLIALADLARWVRQLPAAHDSVSHSLLSALGSISQAAASIERRAAAE